MKTQKTILIFALAAATLAAPACKDKDEDNPDDPSQQQADGMPELDLADETLRNIILQWCDIDRDDLPDNLEGSTFEPEVGLPVEDDPHVRKLQVESVEDADKFACDALIALGIDIKKPDSFSYNDPKVGKVSYKHTSDSNTIAVIDIDIRQIPHLRQIRLVKDNGENAAYSTFYKVGDVVQYTKDNRYYLCVSNHRWGDKSHWISFGGNYDTYDERWLLVGYNTYYPNPMASAVTVRDFVINILFNDEALDKAKQLYNTYKDILPLEDCEALKKCMIEDIYVTTAYDSKPGRVTRAFNEQDDQVEYNGKMVKYAPSGLLLADKMRYQWGLTYSHWVPYIAIVKTENYNDLLSDLDTTRSQNGGISASHFTYKCLTDDPVALQYNNTTVNAHIFVLSVFWQHYGITRTSANGTSTRHYPLVDFTYWDYHPTEGKVRCCPSCELTYTDRGSANSKFKLLNR